MEVKIYDHTNLGEMCWPTSQEAEHAKHFLVPMAKEGVKKYIANVQTRLLFVLVDGHVLPVTVNEREYDNAYLTSNIFTLRHPQEKHPMSLIGAFYSGSEWALRAFKLNKALIINNWLMTTNLYAPLHLEHVRAVTFALAETFPDHALMWRNLDTFRNTPLLQSVQATGYRSFFARHICVYDPAIKGQLSVKALAHHRRDHRLRIQEGCESVRIGAAADTSLERLLELYEGVYIQRHTRYSPRYTRAFLERVLDTQVLSVVELRREGVTLAAMGFYARAGVLSVPFSGFAISPHWTPLLYRMITQLAIEESELRGLPLNDGSGGEGPKQYRGMRRFPEYVALYDRHLPLYRRTFWNCAERAHGLRNPTFS